MGHGLSVSRLFGNIATALTVWTSSFMNDISNTLLPQGTVNPGNFPIPSITPNNTLYAVPSD